MSNNSDNNNKTNIKFPCDFPIKILSKAEFELEEFARRTVHKHAPQMEYVPVHVNLSTKGNYKSITVVVKAENKQQLDDIYQDLSANKAIIMVL